MNVTIIASVLGKENNGTTVACMNLIRYLEKCGDNVKVVCCDKEKKGIDNYYIVPTLSLGKVLNKVIEKNGVEIAKTDNSILKEAIKDADIIHVMVPFSLERAAIKIAKELKIPISAGFHCQAENLTCHLGLMNNRLINYLTYKNFYNHFYKYVDAIHYPTSFIKEVFERTIKHKTNSYVISNGVSNTFKTRDVQKPEELNNKFVILFIGRFSKEKSHKVLLDAMKYSKHKDDIKLIFAGAGPRRCELINHAKKNKIDMPIMKFYSKEELCDVINYSDLYCHPSEVEIEGIACLEALSAGLVPVISDSKRSATKYLAIDDKNLFKCNDSVDLAKKIDYWFEHKEIKNLYKEAYINNTNVQKTDECMKKMRLMFKEVVDNYER